MAAMTTSPFARKRRDTIPLTEDETLVRHGRPLSASWEIALREQIMRDLPMDETYTETAPILFHRPAAPPNVFETPRMPWDAPPLWETLARPRRRRRSILPWLVIAMAVGIGFGLVRDRATREQVVAGARVSAARVAHVLHR
jgi:hypothetical protein